MADKKASEVFKLLADIQKLGGKSTKAIEEKRIATAAPAPSLTQRWEPDFVDGYELKNPLGQALTLRCMWDAFVDGENIAFSGPTGSGKSTLAFHLLDEANESTRVKNRAIFAENETRIKDGAKEDDLESYLALPYQIEHLSCHAETRSAEIIGDIDLVYDDAGNRRPVERWGHVVRAWIEGRILIAEEVDMPDPGVWAGTHQFFDGRTAETDIFLNGVKHLVKHARFRMMATLNTLMQGENQEEYAGTQTQNGAWANRFGYTAIIDYMQPAAEQSLIVKKTGIDKGYAGKMVAAAAKSRQSHKEGAVEAPITTRDILAWSREIVRCQKRTSIKPSSPNYWKDVCVSSAWPTFVCRQPNQSTRDAYMTFLSLR